MTACIIWSWTRWWAATTSHQAYSNTHTHAYHEPGGRLPLLSARPAVTFPLPSLVTEARRCEKLAQGFYAANPAETRTRDLLIASPTLYCSATTPPPCLISYKSDYKISTSTIMPHPSVHSKLPECPYVVVWRCVSGARLHTSSILIDKRRKSRVSH